MQLPTPAAWAWIPIVITAALAQTVRNAAQRTISNALGAWLATLVRFLHGLPFAIVWLVAGACGALASIAWLAAFALRPAADVRILGLIEVFFRYVVSRRLFGENMSKLELAGMCLVLAGVVLVCL